MAENVPYAFRKQVAMTQKFRTDCCMHSPSWDSWPRHHTLCHICLHLCPSVMVAKCPGTSYSGPGTKKTLWLSKSSEHNGTNVPFPARVLFLLVYQSLAPCCLSATLRECPPNTDVTQIIRFQKWQIGNVLISLFCNWLPLNLVTWNLVQSCPLPGFVGIWLDGLAETQIKLIIFLLEVENSTNILFLLKCCVFEASPLKKRLMTGEIKLL